MATARQKRAFTFLSENIRNPKPIPLGQILIRAGYSEIVAKSPTLVTESKGFQELLEEYLPDDEIQKVHREVLSSKYIDHMVFPLAVTDEDIIELVESVGGTVKKFQHSEQATHVWFWAPNPKVRLDAVKLAYQIKGQLSKNDTPPAGNNTYNTFIGNNTVNPNAPKAKELAEETLKILMEKTKRPVDNNTTQNN